MQRARLLKSKKVIVKRKVKNNHLMISNSQDLRKLRNPKSKRKRRLLKMPRVKWLKSLKVKRVRKMIQMTISR
jgi:hypothetical protein